MDECHLAAWAVTIEVPCSFFQAMMPYLRKMDSYTLTQSLLTPGNKPTHEGRLDPATGVYNIDFLLLDGICIAESVL